LGIESIGLFMELQQIGTNQQFFIHTDKEVYLENKTMVGKCEYTFGKLKNS